MTTLTWCTHRAFPSLQTGSLGLLPNTTFEFPTIILRPSNLSLIASSLAHTIARPAWMLLIHVGLLSDSGKVEVASYQ